MASKAACAADVRKQVTYALSLGWFLEDSWGGWEEKEEEEGFPFLGLSLSLRVSLSLMVSNSRFFSPFPSRFILLLAYGDVRIVSSVRIQGSAPTRRAPPTSLSCDVGLAGRSRLRQPPCKRKL